MVTRRSQPYFSHTLFKDFVIPNLNPRQGLLWIVIDNLRYDQYRILEPLINQHYKKEQEHPYFSILPTATQYARNAIFSGMMPSEMEKNYPNYWKNDADKGGKNLFENEFLTEQIKNLNCIFSMSIIRFHH